MRVPTPRDLAEGRRTTDGSWTGENLEHLTTSLADFFARYDVTPQEVADVFAAARDADQTLHPLSLSLPITGGERAELPAVTPDAAAEQPAAEPEAPPERRAERPPSRTEREVAQLLARAETALADADGAVRAEEPWVAEHHRAEATSLIAMAHVRTLGQLVSAGHRRATATASLAGALRLVVER